jgi:histidyl-tRNA synthetase
VSKHTKISPRKLKGFQDYAPEIMQLRLSLIDCIRRHAHLAGFNSIDTPALEYAEVLLGVGGETDKQVYRFSDNGERDVALRFDLTIPFARYVAEHLGTLPLPFKRLQMGPVWRAEKPQKGRFREFWQCDLDIIGVNSVAADSEILLCLFSIMAAIPCGNFVMKVGHRSILTALIYKTLGQLDTEGLNQALICIDKLAKIGPEAVITMLAALPGSQREGAAQLISVLEASPEGATNLDLVFPLLADNAVAREELRQLQDTITLVGGAQSSPQGTVLIDLGIARGLGYYTGIVFETMLRDKPEWGSVCSGGRYNNLLERYVDRQVPGVGGSIGLDRLVAALAENNTTAAASAHRCVFIAVANSAAMNYGFQVATQLRRQGIPCDISLKDQKLGDQFKYANRHSFPLVLTVGSAEAESTTVNLKNMQTGHEDKQLPLHQLQGRIEEITHGTTSSLSSPRT